VAVDGEEAIGFLRRTGPYEMAPRPELILLDLNLPGRGGLHVLAEIKADGDLKPSRWSC
jgi:two-component system, chemotaxis family, response regulator Rcp1